MANLLAGSMVEVVGRGTLDERQVVRKVDTVFDIDTVSMEPLRISRFEHGGRRYSLSTPVNILVSYEDGLWVYSNETLNLWGYAERREEALRELNENFDYMYREIAEEDDDRLDSLAQELKRALLAIVKSPNRGEA